MTDNREYAPRPELAVRDGERPPDGLPDGEFASTWLADGSLRIDRADPRILISEELVELVARGESEWACVESGAGVGALLKIRGVNREVVYRLTWYLPRVRGYIGEWPE